MPTPQQYKKLRDALISAFPEKSRLEQMLYFGLGKHLNEISRDSDLQDITFKLIKTAESQGWLIDLVSAARKENPGNSELEVIALELLLSPETPSISKPLSFSYANVAKPSTQHRKTLVFPAYVVVFVLIAGGTIVWMWNKKPDNQQSQPEHNTTQTFQPTATPGGSHSPATTSPTVATTPPTVTPPTPTPTNTPICSTPPGLPYKPGSYEYDPDQHRCVWHTRPVKP